jgi:hypothetical protein
VVVFAAYYAACVQTYGTKMAEAVAPVSLIASATLAKTGLPRCSEPAFLGFVPPTTFVPASHVNASSSLSGLAVGWAHTVLDGLLCVETASGQRPIFLWCSDCPLTCPAFQ